MQLLVNLREAELAVVTCLILLGALSKSHQWRHGFIKLLFTDIWVVVVVRNGGALHR